MYMNVAHRQPWWFPLFLLITYVLTLGAVAAVGQHLFPLAWEVGSPVIAPIILIAYLMRHAGRTAFPLGQVGPKELSVGLLSGGLLYGFTAMTSAWVNSDLTAISAFSAIVLAPVAEEAFYRGYLFPALAGRFGKVAALILSSALFGVLHGPNLHQIALALVAGIIFTSLFASTRSLVPPLLSHSLYNSLVVFL